MITRLLTKVFQPTASSLALFSTMTPHANSTAAAAAATNECDALSMARNLKLPSREEMLRRDPKVYSFWNENDKLLEQAWKEWQQSDDKALALPPLDDSIINPKLKKAIDAAWENPNGAGVEAAVKDLWVEMAPGVYGIEFFDADKVQVLRQWLEVAGEAGIPTRPPYGIVLNRKGMMMDPRSVGYLAAPDFQSFYQNILIDRYVRPIGRLLFPEFIQTKDDSESFAFSIQYQAGGDESIRPHSDASTITFNINLDLEQTWTGSELYFWPSGDKSSRQTVAWKPGMAMIHLGRTLHAALPIESGTRSNLVVWTMPRNGGRSYGGIDPLMLDDGRYPEEYQLAPEDRWALPINRSNPASWDRWSPF